MKYRPPIIKIIIEKNQLGRIYEVILVDKAIEQGYRNIISVGGDGTLHHVINGIMKQRYIKTSKIKLGVIPDRKSVV